MRHITTYTFLFAGVMCVLCGILVSAAAVLLLDRQEQNIRVDKLSNVLQAAGRAGQGEKLSAAEVQKRFQGITPVAIDLETGARAEAVDPLTHDQKAALSDSGQSREAPPNAAVIKRVPNVAVTYEVRDESGGLEMVVLPIEGYGLWSTLYGFLALDADLNTIRGITYYQHGETPGLGGEVDNPRWKRLWAGRTVYDESGKVVIRVIKGNAGPVASDPHHVDGLSGATLTNNGVTHMLDFWLGPDGFGPYLKRLREEHHE